MYDRALCFQTSAGESKKFVFRTLLARRAREENCRRQQCIENENEKRTANVAYLHADDRVDEEEHGNQQANVGKSLDGK